MDKDFKLFYYALLTGKNEIEPDGNMSYKMLSRVANKDLISACKIGFSLDNEFKINKGLEVFRWYFSKHIKV